jgi:hypothetical protein
MSSPTVLAAEPALIDGLAAIADRLRHARNVVVMLGAGASVSAGIPDFRTPGTGLYSQASRGLCRAGRSLLGVRGRLCPLLSALCRIAFGGRPSPTPRDLLIPRPQPQARARSPLAPPPPSCRAKAGPFSALAPASQLADTSGSPRAITPPGPPLSCKSTACPSRKPSSTCTSF